MPTARVAALIVAAGAGVRFGGDVPKQYQKIAGRRVIDWAVRSFRASSRVDMIRCVIDEAAVALYRAACDEPPLAIPGGATRQESVRRGLEALAAEPEPPDRVLIHDGARPFVPPAVIDAVLDALDQHDAAAPALPVPDTLCLAEPGGFGEDVDRANFIRRQTPQGFRLDAILAAHRAHGAVSATDDIAIARMAGLRIGSVPGSMALHKLTTRDDMMLLDRLLTDIRRPSVGSGYDVHAFGPGDRVVLCGVEVPHEAGLVGHSDADVAMHALTDAMLGAVAAGDIGQHYPPSDPQWRGAASKVFLEGARQAIVRQGGRLESVDVTIICERPKIGPHREAMQASLARLLDLDIARVNVKATTTERLGFTGRGEGIAAMATATVTLPC